MMRGRDGLYNERTKVARYRDLCGIDHKGACTKKAKVGRQTAGKDGLGKDG